MLTDLPAEVLLDIVQYAILPDQPAEETLEAYVRRVHALLSVSRYLNRTTQAVVGAHVHMFIPAWRPAIIVDLGPAHPGTFATHRAQSLYWNHHQPSPPAERPVFQFLNAALHSARLPCLRSASFDFWVTPDLPPSAALRFGNDVVAFLELMAASTSCIEDLCIRLPFCQDAIGALERIVANQPNLHRLHVQVQSGVPRCHRPRPRFNLLNLALRAGVYVPLQVFILRAPTCDIDCMGPSYVQQPFLDRIRLVLEFGMMCSALCTSVPAWVFIHHLLRSTTQVQLCEFSVASTDKCVVPKTRFRLRTIVLPVLQHLTLQVHDVDTYLLRHVSAPRLRALRIRSYVDAGLWPTCDINHFPELNFVHLQFPGNALLRLHAVGVPLNRFRHNVPAIQPDVDIFESVPYISAQGPDPPTPFHPPYVRPQRLCPFVECEAPKPTIAIPADAIPSVSDTQHTLPNPTAKRRRLLL
ncbi:hypothetical protein CF326_g1959 [Tilletia indica]|nr:hypothetical protein CF326_g1959 [Tilletia indica]